MNDPDQEDDKWTYNYVKIKLLSQFKAGAQFIKLNDLVDLVEMPLKLLHVINF